VDAKSLALLEFPAIRTRLADATGFAPSRRLAEAHEPSSDPVVVERWLEETSQARAFVAERPGVGIAGARDIGPAIERAARGGRLEPAQLLEVGDTLRAAAGLRDALAEDRRPLLRDLGRAIQPLPSLRSTLERSVDPGGELLDTASARLGGLRRAVRVAYERLRTRLEQMVHSADLGGALQEPIVTLRNGRYVVPVRADARSRVKGIVHDASGSGQTLFVEPLVAVEMGNAWREAQLAEQVEIERILDELSTLVGSAAPALRDTLDALARFDFWSARARLAEEMDATRAETGERLEIVLLGARHPGLSGRVVPIDVRLGGDVRALVITGPNTGGKTVSLRTLGLLACMHQAGLHLPAEAGSRLPVLRNVFADIGDEQSIRRAGGSHHPLRRAEGLRSRHAGGEQRLGRVRPGDAQPHLSPADRPSGREPGVRHRRAAGSAPSDRGRGPLQAHRGRGGVRGDARLHPRGGHPGPGCPGPGARGRGQGGRGAPRR
jgi:DNA mismatch repair protein MutS2